MAYQQNGNEGTSASQIEVHTSYHADLDSAAELDPSDLPPEELVGSLISVGGFGTGRVVAFQKAKKSFGPFKKNANDAHIVDFSVAPSSWPQSSREPAKRVELRLRKGATYSNGEFFILVDPIELEQAEVNQAEEAKQAEAKQARAVNPQQEKVNYCNAASPQVRTAFSKKCKADGTWEKTSDDWRERKRLLLLFMDSEEGKAIIDIHKLRSTKAVDSNEVHEEVQAQTRRRGSSQAVMHLVLGTGDDGEEVIDPNIVTQEKIITKENLLEEGELNREPSVDNSVEQVADPLPLEQRSPPGYAVGQIVYLTVFSFQFDSMPDGLFEVGTAAIVFPILRGDPKGPQGVELAKVYFPLKGQAHLLRTEYLSKTPVRYAFQKGSACAEFTDTGCANKGSERGLFFNPMFYLGSIMPSILVAYSLSDGPNWGDKDGVACATGFPEWVLIYGICCLVFIPAKTLSWQLFVYSAALKHGMTERSLAMTVGVTALPEYTTVKGGPVYYTREGAVSLGKWADRLAHFNRIMLKFAAPIFTVAFLGYTFYGFSLLFSSEVDCGPTLYNLVLAIFIINVVCISCGFCAISCILPICPGQETQSRAEGTKIPMVEYCFDKCVPPDKPDSGSVEEYWAAGPAELRKAFMKSMSTREWETKYKNFDARTEGLRKFAKTKEGKEILEWVAAQEDNRGGQWVKDENGKWGKA